MKENYELYEHIYQDSEMACYTIEKLTKDLKNKDNKIKPIVENILKEYQSFKEKAEKELEKNNQEIRNTNFMEKMMASMGIKKEVKNDNSDSSIADLLIQGISMGSLDTEKKLKSYHQEVSKKEVKFTKDFLQFQEKSIEELKKYL